MLRVLPYTHQLKVLYTLIRNKDTNNKDFVFYSDRIIRLLVEEGLNLLPVVDRKIVTPTGRMFEGYDFAGKVCAVSIVRAGESMEKAIREVCQSIRIGKILIQRNEENAQPVLYYSKLPKDVSERHVFLLDPMLATGGSAITAINVLKDNGVDESKIIFLNLISCLEGLKKVGDQFPNLEIVTGFVDQELNAKSYILPGLGDFGDRYFGTE